MPKTEPADLKKWATEDFVTYLLDGTIDPDNLARSFDYRGVEIEQFDRLLELHYVLHPDVVRYVEQLRQRLRRIKTEHQPTQEVHRGEVRGPINWPQTFAQRMAVGYNDRTLFVVNDPKVELDIPENRIVKRLLGVVVKPLRQYVRGKDPGWAEMWDDEDIVGLERTLAHNVHLSELPDYRDISVTDREIATARQSRHDLYAEGARLLRIHRDLLNRRLRREEVREFLRRTIVSPEQDFQAFELFCLFGVIRWLRNEEYLGLASREISGGTQSVARLEDSERTVEVFYNVTKPLIMFEKYPSADSLADSDVPEFIPRHARALETHEKANEVFLGKSRRHSFYGGRPDFIVTVKRQTPEGKVLSRIIIGEVKYTETSSTFSSGLKQLLEYLHLAKESGSWLLGDSLPEEAVEGIICSDGVDTDVNSWQNIRHWDTDRLREEF